MSKMMVSNGFSALLIAPLFLVIFAADAKGAGDDEASRPRAVDALFAEMKQPNTPGAAVGIYRHGMALYRRGYGLADIEHQVPITPRTVFNLASVSKQFTAFSIALLAREGKVDLQADIRTYLPWMPDLGQRITVDHLLHHVSGVRDYVGLAALGGQDDQSLVHQAHVRNILARQTALNAEPGTEYAYSNAGYALLAEIVQAASGQTPRAFMDERVFRPLGMTHTQVRDENTEIIADYATGYENGEGNNAWKHAVYNRMAIGPGNIVSTADDLAKWAGNFANPKVGDRALIEQITTMGSLEDGTPINYGFGLRRHTFAGHEGITHTGSISGFRAIFAYLPVQDLAIIVLANHPATTTELAEKIVRIYLGEGAAKDVARKSDAARSGGSSEGSAKPAPVELAAVALAELAGEYHAADIDTSYTLAVESGHILLRSLWLTVPQVLTPTAADKFAVKEGPLEGLDVTVRRNAKGALQELLFDYGGVRNLRVKRLP